MSEDRPDRRPPDDRSIFRARHLELRARGRWEYASRPNASAVVAVFAEHRGCLICVEQRRPPVDATVLEVPAGLVGDTDDGDEPALAAARELEEETGYRAAELELVTVGPPSAGLSDEIVHFFRATGLERVGDGGGVDGENITLHRVPLDHAEDWIYGWARTRGRLVDPKVWAALWFLRDR